MDGFGIVKSENGQSEKRRKNELEITHHEGNIYLNHFVEFIASKVADTAKVGKLLLEIRRKVRDASTITIISFSLRHEYEHFLGK